MFERGLLTTGAWLLGGGGAKIRPMGGTPEGCGGIRPAKGLTNGCPPPEGPKLPCGLSVHSGGTMPTVASASQLSVGVVPD